MTKRERTFLVTLLGTTQMKHLENTLTSRSSATSLVFRDASTWSSLFRGGAETPAAPTRPSPPGFRVGPIIPGRRWPDEPKGKPPDIWRTLPSSVWMTLCFCLDSQLGSSLITALIHRPVPSSGKTPVSGSGNLWLGRWTQLLQRFFHVVEAEAAPGTNGTMGRNLPK